MYKNFVCIVLLLTLLAISCAKNVEIMPEGATAKKIASGFKFTEGPAVDQEGNLFFTDIPNNTIIKITPAGKQTVFRKKSGAANGLMFDAEGRLVACEGGRRRVTRTEKSGKIIVLADSYKDKKLNSPNDLIIGRDGSIYFTDPRFGGVGDVEQPVEGVYRIAPDGKFTLVIDDMKKPNGIFLSPDQKTLYVSDSAQKLVRAYTVKPEGSFTDGRDFAKMASDKPGAPDGMTLDIRGNLYATGPGGTWVFDKTGKHLLTIETDEIPANCTFGGKDNQTLYITARTSVYSIKLNIPGVTIGEK